MPESLDLVVAASLGCRFATSFRAIVDQAKVQPGEWVAVHGCGGVGLSAVMIAHAMGGRVIAIDIDQTKLDLARRLGAEVGVLAGDDVRAAIVEHTKGGAHVSMDALGSRATCYNSIACLRPQGRHVQVGLMLGAHADPPVPMGLVIAKELQVMGSHGMQAHRYGAMLDLILTGRLQPSRLIDRTIPLTAAPAVARRNGQLPLCRHHGNRRLRPLAAGRHVPAKPKFKLSSPGQPSESNLVRSS